MNLNKSNQINPFNEALKIAFIYFIGSSFWIFFTDAIVFYIFGEEKLDYNKIQTYKGILFVLVSSIMIYFLAFSSLNKINTLDKTLEDKIEEIDLKTRALRITQEDYEKTIQYLGSFDTVTGLPNRLHFKNKFNEIIESKGNYSAAILYIDIDNFRHINDSYGYSAGDKLLLDLSIIISKSIPDNNVLSRITADEFGILLTGMNSKEELDIKVKEIQDVIRTPWIFDNEEVYVSSTIGITEIPKDGIDFEELLKKANIAMQYGKINSKTAYVYYDDSIKSKVLNDTAMLSDVRKALTNKEFKLHYQIIQNLENDKVHGVECLIRWYHPEKGYIPPLSFIPIVEKTNLIYEIRNYVVDEALSQKRKWKDMGMDIPIIGINISLRSFCDINMVDFIEEKMKEYGIKRSEVALELTESGVVDMMDNLESNLLRLRTLGVRISLDDFGTGYSSLARLKDLSVDSIKIDKSFIDNIVFNKEDEAMVAGVIYFAKSRNLLVVAEGIETEEQKIKLKELGCNLGQGYYIAKPLPPDQLKELID